MSESQFLIRRAPNNRLDSLESNWCMTLEYTCITG